MIAGDMTFTGDNSRTIRTMEEVCKSPLHFGDTFQTKDILSMRIAEEANLSLYSSPQIGVMINVSLYFARVSR